MFFFFGDQTIGITSFPVASTFRHIDTCKIRTFNQCEYDVL